MGGGDPIASDPRDAVDWSHSTKGDVIRSFIVTLIAIGFASSALAKEDLGQGRLFLGTTTTKPSEVNTELKAQDLKTIERLGWLGVEITFPTFGVLQTGLRYTRHSTKQDPNTSGTGFYADLTQDSMQGIVRYGFLGTDNVKMDVFLGAGAGKTTYTEKFATQDGKLDKGASFVASGGVSLALGAKQFFLVLEGGYESNKVDGFTRSGTLNDNIKSIDMSGPYFMIGLMFDAIPIFKK